MVSWLNKAGILTLSDVRRFEADGGTLDDLAFLMEMENDGLRMDGNGRKALRNLMVYAREMQG